MCMAMAKQNKAIKWRAYFFRNMIIPLNKRLGANFWSMNNLVKFDFWGRSKFGNIAVTRKKVGQCTLNFDEKYHRATRKEEGNTFSDKQQTP